MEDLGSLSPALASETRAPITVLHLLHTVAYGGVETALLGWIGRMDPERFRVHLMCFANPDGSERPFVEAAERLGHEVSTLRWSRRKPVLRCARELARRVRELGVDVLHTHNTYADCVGAVTRLLVPVRTVTTLYVWTNLGFKRKALQWINQRVIRGYDQISAHCEETHRQTVERGFRPEELKTLICGFEAEVPELGPGERSRLRRARGVADDEVLLANVARFYPEKAQDDLLRSFAEIHRQEPRTRLWMIGVGPLEARLHALCTRLGLDDAVDWLGFDRDLMTTLALVDVQVHPSHVEGVPLAICSGMAAGLAIVGSNVGGMSEVLKTGSTGILVPPRDLPAFEREVLRLVRDEGERRRLGAEARRFIETEYSLDTAVARVEATYEEVVGRCG
ncbi:MAG TPA: glycosyltransferase family 4 protein [Myxococcota bacterium]|jgi:glycosyltransferase involved in cell wall biosynthesis